MNPWLDSPDDPGGDGFETSDLAAVDIHEPNPADETIRTVLFTATNPAGTVSATVLMSGRIVRVDLAPPLSMTETELAAEITLITTLAQMQARAGQHAVLAMLMRARGQDPARTASFLERDLGLPRPERVTEEQQRVFALCYAGDDA
ncbi:YbaB/EbfC family DNA-binding protein [Mycobacterium sp. ITM-2016-00317]|uniref:YbaB/EbfC family DNA-binding protein n=1 Tax=Mycobacterium sp. ITM-2016-00317 TaxID=2099694 RepID=UPI000D3FF206|nr:YbaB/EbfC family DNA-binding protein [Mycobacterium sp. ITM-2016-00317]WNG87371.1 YbaB/EbfC family DNA-binding protein [Mycobacterium sp. ITM-2016-00317]